VNGEHILQNTFYREHILQRTHSTENTFYREHILQSKWQEQVGAVEELPKVHVVLERLSTRGGQKREERDKVKRGRRSGTDYFRARHRAGMKRDGHNAEEKPRGRGEGQRKRAWKQGTLVQKTLS